MNTFVLMHLHNERRACVRACVCMRADVHHASVVPAGSMLALT